MASSSWQLAMASMTGMDVGDGQSIDVGLAQSKFKVSNSSEFESFASPLNCMDIFWMTLICNSLLL